MAKPFQTMTETTAKRHPNWVPNMGKWITKLLLYIKIIGNIKLLIVLHLLSDIWNCGTNIDTKLDHVIEVLQKVLQRKLHLIIQKLDH